MTSVTIIRPAGHSMAACNKGRYLTVGQLASYLGVAKRSAAKMIDAGFLPGSFRLPVSTVSRVPLQSALTLAKQNGMDESSRELERLAIDRGLQVVTRPELLVIGPPEEFLGEAFQAFNFGWTSSLFVAGLMFFAQPLRRCLGRRQDWFKRRNARSSTTCGKRRLSGRFWESLWSKIRARSDGLTPVINMRGSCRFLCGRWLTNCWRSARRRVIRSGRNEKQEIDTHVVGEMTRSARPGAGNGRKQTSAVPG